MDVLPLGRRYPGGQPLFPPASLDQLAARPTALGALSSSARRLGTSPWTFDERKAVRQPNLSEPAEVGWTFLVAADDPDKDSLTAALADLAAHSNMADPAAPLIYPANEPDWIDDGYLGLGDVGPGPGHRPAYVLLAGDPVHLPFTLQVDLAAAGAIVGRLALDDRASLEAYVAKVIACETATDPRPQATAVVLAPEVKGDVTTYSRRFMAEPISRLLNGDAHLMSLDLLGPDATRANLLHALKDTRPAIVFTASHGAAVVTADGAAEQRRVNGAWCLEPPAPAGPTDDWDWLLAEELPDQPFCPGGIVVQFACFGGGTSDHSSYAAWLGPEGSNEFDAEQPFVAALPKALLAHPDGPVAHVGHVDVAVLHGFDDPAKPVPAGGADSHPRLEPFKTLVRRAVGDLAPVGFALRDLHARAASMSATIATTFDRLQQRGIDIADMPPADRDAFLDVFIRRNDAMHFLLSGDPAARVRIDG